MSDLPDIGATVRARGGATGTVEKHQAFVRWPEGGGAWFTADEIWTIHRCRLADCPTCLADHGRTGP